MAMRNWWVEVEIDGRKTKLAGGPRAKDGGFELTIRQRDEGESVEVLRVWGIVRRGGYLETSVMWPQSATEVPQAYTTER